MVARGWLLRGQKGSLRSPRGRLVASLFSKWQPDLLMFRSRKFINNFIFSNNHQCDYTKTISCVRRREYRRIVTSTLSR